MTDAEAQAAVLKVLAGQSPGYLAHADASAFVAAGLTDTARVESALATLAARSHVEEQEEVIRQTDPETGDSILDDDGNPVEIVADSGWVITDAGRAQQLG